MRRTSLIVIVSVLAVLVVVAVAVRLANFGSPNSRGPTGTLTGALQVEGGPPGAGPRPLAGQVTPLWTRWAHHRHQRRRERSILVARSCGHLHRLRAESAVPSWQRDVPRGEIGHRDQRPHNPRAGRLW